MKAPVRLYICGWLYNEQQMGDVPRALAPAVLLCRGSSRRVHLGLSACLLCCKPRNACGGFRPITCSELSNGRFLWTRRLTLSPN